MKQFICAVLMSFSFQCLASLPTLSMSDQEAIVSEIGKIHSRTNLCTEGKVSFSEVRIDQVLTVVKGAQLQAVGQSSYGCRDSEEKVKGEYCVFNKHVPSNTWIVEYCES